VGAHDNLPHDASALPQRLKAATRELHARAERSGVMARLLAGTISRSAYVALLGNLHAIYAALEPVTDTAATGTSLFASLERSAALEADLCAFGAANPALVPATLEYVERLHALRATGAHRVWAHVYVRYLGDLHGGQVLSQRVRRLFAVPQGTNFYEFGDLDHVHGLRTRLRVRLAALQLDAGQADDVVAEATWAFEAHCRIFEQIQPTP
jgi:heme oxygenase (biliverdin-producing, ferredoxin)